MEILRKVRLKRDTLSKYGIYIAFLIITLILSILTDRFFTASNIVNILRQVSINGILAVGMTFVIITGGIDLSVGSILALTGIIAAKFSVIDNSPMPLAIAILIGLSISIGIGLINGFMITKGRVAPFIATLSMMTIARGLGLVVSRGRPIVNLTDAYREVGGGYIGGSFPIPVLIFIMTVCFAYFILKYMRFGRHVYAVGDCEPAARASGVKTIKIKMGVYALSGMMAGLAGIVLSSRVNAASPVAGQGAELDAIAAVVIGGTSLSGGIGSVIGTVIGALIIGIISNGLDIMNVSAYYQQIIKGLIIVIAVLIDRKG